MHPAAHSDVGLTAEQDTVRTTQLTLKYLFGLVPIVAGADKFTNLLVHWESYLNPHLASVISPSLFMHIVGVIEIVAGVLVLVKPRIGGYVVMVWLLAIALQLVAQGQYLDVAVRDIVLALGGALTLARLTPLTEGR
ncbi:MAG TPA: tRNA (5-methylaminomethyl-2-thiouridylate)-methyltransferase [Candidatus Didemnitutus sp.]